MSHDAMHIEEMQAVIDRATIPGRRPEPKLAPELDGVEMLQVSTTHAGVAAWRVGSGSATLLVHGWRDSSRLWGLLMGALVASGGAFVVFDLPAHGFSGGDRRSWPVVSRWSHRAGAGRLQA